MKRDFVIFDIETTSIIPAENGRVTCISCMEVATEKMTTFMDLDEQKMLNDFWNYVRSFPNPCFCGFNCLGFDIPYLMHRSCVRDVAIAYFSPLDLWLIPSGFFLSYDKKMCKGNLEYWGVIMGKDVKKENGEAVIKLFMEGKYEDVKRHCEEDVITTYELFKRCKKNNFISDHGALFGKY